MRGKSWLFEGKVLGCAVVTVALIPKREFEKTDEEEKNEFIRDMAGDVTPLFFFQNTTYRRPRPIFKHKRKLG